MKKLYLILLSLIIVFASILLIFNVQKSVHISQNSVQNSIISVIIDPGHGGLDNGTSAKDGTREKDINLQIALNLRDYLGVCGISTQMTRDGDYELYYEGEERNRSDLYNRLDFINSFDNAIMVSIHQNFFTDAKEWGIQIWHSSNGSDSKKIADNIQNVNNQLLNNTNNRKNKESTDDYYILYNAKHPSVMVECGFMSNREENNKLKNAEYQQALAMCMMLGINEYIGKNYG